MGLAELFLLAIGLSMDAFAVAICKGLSTRTLQKKALSDCGRVVWRLSGADAHGGLFSGRGV